MSTTNREDSPKPLSTADLARAGRRGEDAPNSDVDYTEEEVTRLDVAQPPGVQRSRDAAEDADTRERSRGSSRDAREDERSRATSPAPSAAGDREERSEEGRSGSRAVADRIARSPESASGRGRPGSGDEALEPLFASGLAESFRERWTSIQSGFVDDPKQAVRRGDELVAEVMSNLAQGFAAERQRMEAQLDATGEGATENLRVALRRYRSFFERLLAL